VLLIQAYKIGVFGLFLSVKFLEKYRSDFGCFLNHGIK